VSIVQRLRGDVEIAGRVIVTTFKQSVSDAYASREAAASKIRVAARAIPPSLD
jgi:hypothetical protein